MRRERRSGFYFRLNDGEPYFVPNDWTKVGAERLFDIYFANSGASIASWYIGLIDGSAPISADWLDTLASHAGWTEFTGYSGSRKGWNKSIIKVGGISTLRRPLALIPSSTSMRVGLCAGSFSATTRARGAHQGFCSPLRCSRALVVVPRAFLATQWT